MVNYFYIFKKIEKNRHPWSEQGPIFSGTRGLKQEMTTTYLSYILVVYFRKYS